MWPRQFVSIFYRADFISQEDSLGISGRVTAREKQFKLFAFVYTLISQVKGLISIQNRHYRVRRITAFKTQAILVMQNI